MTDLKLTRYAVEFKMAGETIQFIIVVPASSTLQIVQDAMEASGWELVTWRSLP